MLFLCLCILLSVAKGQISFDKTFPRESGNQLTVSKIIEVQNKPTSSQLSQVCVTNEDGPSKNSPCVFPFIFSGRTYEGCTQEFDSQRKFWCSTKVTPDHHHIIKEGHWGYCGSNCVFIDREKVKRNRLKPKITTGIRQTTLDSKETETTTTSTTTTDEITEETVIRNNNILFGDGQDALPTAGDDDEEFCGFNNGVGFIVGGQDAKRGAFPFVAILGYRDSEGGIAYGCGGTLISRRYVVTAAHCHHASDAKLQIAEIILGEHIVNYDPDCPGCPFAQKFEINPEDVTVHENYVEDDLTSNGNDIALIRLPRDAVTILDDPEEFVMPICLPKSSADVFEDASEYLIVGWGRTSNEATIRGRHKYDILQQLRLNVLGGRECKRKYPAYNFIDESKQICAGGVQGQDSCNGDSGGPLIAVHRKPTVKMFLAGIVSFGTTRCGTGFPGVYTNLYHYMPWIREHMRTAK